MTDFNSTSSVLEVKDQSVWLPLQMDSLMFMPFIQLHSSCTKNGYHVLQSSNDYIKILVRGVLVFSFNVHLYNCDKATVLISYNSGDKQDELEEEITTPDNYTIPAIFTDKNQLTAIKLTVLSGSIIPTDVHLLNSYSKVVWE